MAFFSLKKKLEVNYNHKKSVISYTFNIFIHINNEPPKNPKPYLVQAVTSTGTKEELLASASFSRFRSASKPVPARNRKRDQGGWFS